MLESLARTHGWTHEAMMEMPYRLLCWYSYQQVKCDAAEELRILDREIIYILRDPGEPYKDLRSELSFIAKHGYARGPEVLTPQEFRRRVQQKMTTM